jgi:mannitol-1-/sugar-/sorbitol-6-phosphatase
MALQRPGPAPELTITMPPVVLDCDAVLFDMDGTLVDSRALVERMWLRWAERRGVSAEAILAVAHGRRTLETMQLVAPQFATAEEAAQLDTEEEAEAREHGGETAVAGAASLLQALPIARWAIVTSADAEIARRRVAGVGLPVPRLLIGAADVQVGKPDPEGYRQAARALGFEPARCVVVEDTPAGVQAGRAAGARVVGMLTTYATLDDCDALVLDLRSIQVAPPNASGGLRLQIAAEGARPT